MKKTTFYIITAILLLNIIGCSEEPPSIRTNNQLLSKVNVQFKTSNNTVNQNDLLPAVMTNYQDISEGRVQVTANIQNESVVPAIEFNASNDNNYTILIVDSSPPILKIISSGK